MAGPRPWWRRALLWEIPFVAALAAFMFRVRMLPYKPMTANDQVYLFGSDSYYHYREILGIVRSFPRIPRFDPWTFFPFGTATNQFGTLFDWIAAAYVVLTEGKGATEVYIQKVSVAYPAFVGALIIIPFYFLAKRMVGRPGAIIASLTLAVLPGEFLVRSMASYADHHVAEALMSVTVMLGFLVAVEHGHAHRREIRDLRNVRQYWRVLAWGLVGGLAIGVALYTWPPALLFIAILAIWHTIVVLLTNASGEDARGIAFSGAVAYAVGGLLLLPAIETSFIGDFNAYGPLQVIAPLAAAAWILAVDVISRRAHARGITPWALPGAIVGLVVLAYFALLKVAPNVMASINWGLSWVTGFGVQDTTRTIGEARPADFFCSADAGGGPSCLGNDFGMVVPLTFILLLALIVYAVWRRRPEDILLALWSIVIFRATDTQVRFSYYLAINMALLLGWAAGRLAASLRLEESLSLAARPVPEKGRGRRTNREATRAASGGWWKLAVVASVFLFVLPGNVIANASKGQNPGWVLLEGVSPEVYAPDVVLWRPGLEWMREHTPEAGVDLSLVTPRPAAGAFFDYPPETYGVLSWWDYGHYIETIGLRAPVANPFQQAAPFAAIYFTERDPAQADRLLQEWVQGEGPVKYIAIDDEMATGKFGAIALWANSANASRDRWADGDYLEQRTYSTPTGDMTLYSTGPQYEESMMARLYDQDAQGLSHYRLVYEINDYVPMGTIAAADGSRLRCLHDVLNSRSCYYPLSAAQINQYVPGTAIQAGDGLAYDLSIVSRLKFFERVEGARLTGTTTPGATVSATLQMVVEQSGSAIRGLTHTVTAQAGPDGTFEVVFPYATSEPLGPANGGTDVITRATGPVVVSMPGRQAAVHIPERAVLYGESIAVPAA